MKRTVILIVVLTVIAAVLVILALQTEQPVINEPTPKQQVSVQPVPNADTSLRLSPDTVALGTGAGKVDVVIDTGKNKVNAVQLEIAYDPNVITNVTITPGSFLQSPITLLDLHDKTTGRISYALALTPAGEPVQGTGTVASLTFSRNNAPINTASQTQISILDKSLITETGGKNSLLKETSGATVIIMRPENAVPLNDSTGTTSGTPAQ
jgi:hypothetical protein